MQAGSDLQADNIAGRWPFLCRESNLVRRREVLVLF
jgi:hypothetical protein